MPVPQFLTDLLALLYQLAYPASALTLFGAGLSLRTEGGMNFHLNGRTGRWLLWTAILLTVPGILQWLAGQGIHIVPDQGQGIAEAWINAPLQAFKNFVALILKSFVPIAAAYLVLKATLDFAAHENLLGSVIAAIFVLSIPATQAAFKTWNDGTPIATANVLASFWNYLAAYVMPGAAGLAVIGGIYSFALRRPFLRYAIASLAFLTLSTLNLLVRKMAA